MKSNLKLLFVSVYCILGASSCKVNSTSQKTNDTTTLSDSTVNLAYNSQAIKLNPDEAIVIINIISSDKNNHYMASVNQLSNQGFGFSANLKAGDSINVKSSKKELVIGSQYNCILQQTKSINSASSIFSLIRVIDN